MENNIDINELEQQCIEAEKLYQELKAQYDAAKKAEEEAKKAKLAEEKTARYDAVVNAYYDFEKLKDEYIKDYGFFSFDTDGKNGRYMWHYSSSNVK